METMDNRTRNELFSTVGYILGQVEALHDESPLHTKVLRLQELLHQVFDASEQAGVTRNIISVGSADNIPWLEPINPKADPIIAKVEATEHQVIPRKAYNPFNTNGKKGKREWTDEQRAEASKRAKARHTAKEPLIPDSHLAIIVERFDEGESCERIGKSYSCSSQTVRNYLERNGKNPKRNKLAVAVATPGIKNDEQWIGKRDREESAQWYPDDWLEIKAMLKAGKTLTTIAGDYGVTKEELQKYIDKNMVSTGESKPTPSPSMALG